MEARVGYCSRFTSFFPRSTALILLVLLLCGCGSSGPPQAAPPPPPNSPPPLLIATASLPNGEVGVFYQATLQATGGAPPYRWSIASGVLPGQLTFDITGVISGTPSGAGTFQVTFRVEDSATSAATSLATYSMIVVTPLPLPPLGRGIWITPDELRQLPMSGPAWENMKKEADGSCGTPKLSNQDDDTNVCILAKGLVYARTGNFTYRDDVTKAITKIVNSDTYKGRALALGRELAAYVIAADLIDLPNNDPALDQLFRDKLRELLITPTKDGPDNLLLCHEERPNNWGTMCGGSRAAVAAYLGEKEELGRVAQVFKGFLGDSSSYAGFHFGSDDQNARSWSPLPPDQLVPINPKNSSIGGQSVDGAVIDDISRGGPFQWPPLQTNYPWEGLAGAIVQAEILCRNGYPDVYGWGDGALRRSYEYLRSLDSQFGFWFDSGTVSGDDNWQPWIANRRYAIHLPTVTPTRPGKQMAWSDWTHGAAPLPASCAAPPASALTSSSEK